MNNTQQANLNAHALWQDVTANLPFDTAKTQATGIALDPTPGHRPVACLSISGFAAATGIGHIFKTADFGAIWSEADGAGGPAPLPDVPTLRILVDRTDSTGNTLLAGTDSGVTCRCGGDLRADGHPDLEHDGRAAWAFRVPHAGAGTFGQNTIRPDTAVRRSVSDRAGDGDGAGAAPAAIVLAAALLIAVGATVAGCGGSSSSSGNPVVLGSSTQSVSGVAAQRAGGGAVGVTGLPANPGTVSLVS